MKRYSIYSFIKLYLLLGLMLANVAIGDAKPKPKRTAQQGLVQFADNHSLRICLSHEALQRDWLLASRIQDISQQEIKAVRVAPGQRFYNPLQLRFEQEGGELLVWREADNFYPKRLANKPWLRLAIEREEDGKYLVDFAPLMLRLYEGLDPVAGRMAPESTGASLELCRRYAHSRGLEVDLYQKFKELDVHLRHSLYLLPKQVMQARRDDARVGYYSLPTHQGGHKQLSINRYRVKRGTKIHYWVDPRFPKLWQEGIIEGIRDWNAAFRAIGLGDVLTASLYPNDRTFDPDAMTVNTFRYVESDFPNAQGKFWSDPRSGEIIQSDVLFYSSVKNLLYKWYYLQTAAYNPTARKATLPDSVERRLIRYAAAHEIGHCLGLEHNYRASASFTTDSLRSPAFTYKYGTTPSIMDYARLNNIAQPNDGVQQMFPPILGLYDMYAIAYGYGIYPRNEAEILSKLVDESRQNPYLQYEKLIRGAGAVDPLIQANSLGDDGLKSTDYALRNLRYILAHRAEWGESPITLSDIAEDYYLHLSLLKPYLGGIYKHTLSADGKDVRFMPVPENYQRAVRSFLDKELERAKILFPPNTLNTKTKRLLKDLRD